MSGEYRKYTVEMELESSEYRLWKRGMDSCICMAESYKTKRSIYFSVTNFLPSENLIESGGREYHLVMIGAENGNLIHRDFGAFYINQRGEGNFFKKFDGPELECYTHCLLLAVSTVDGTAETILKGAMPFAGEEHKTVKLPWNNGSAAEVFAEGHDETDADWRRIDDIGELPEFLRVAEALIGKYNHYILGEKDDRWFIGVPGRFLKSEQPDGFQLWQPLRGGEKYYENTAELTGKLCEEIFGYWITEVDKQTGNYRTV